MNKVKYILVAFVYLLASQVAFSQISTGEKVPLDPRVKVGKLENGLTYYIQHNPRPENKVELRLAINAGSILEEDNQQGLAHFVEHMAFNGTRNFEKNELVNYLQSIGVSFGADLNAYTGFDETVYILPIPSENDSILRNGFKVLSDWAGGVLMKDEDIDEERGIIVEEWRTGEGYSKRMQDQYLPVILHQSKYAERLPIGKMEIVENFDYETLRSFYQDWYIPDNMAVIAVGDVDPEKLEALVKEYFSELKNPENAKERKSFEVPEHQETFVSVVTDEEAPGIQLQFFYKHKALPTETREDYQNLLIRTLYGGMLTQRLEEIRQKPNAPFVFAGTGYGNFVRDLDYFSASAVVTSGKIEAGLQSLLLENERVARFGFTEPELDRVKKSVLNSTERSFNEMDKAESRAIVGRYVNHFLGGKFADGEKWKHEFYQEIIPQITLEEINALAGQLVRNENRVVIITAPETEKDNIPSETEVLALMEGISDTSLEPYSEKALEETLMKQLPEPVKVLETEFVESIGLTTLTFPNGAKVFVKPTDFKNDEIILLAKGDGGVSLYPDADHYSASYAGVMVNIMGVGGFSPSDLRKVLAGKTVSLTPNVLTYSQEISGATSPKDLETTLQLLHLYYTQARKDQELFDVYMANQKSQLASAQSNPDYQFSKALNRIIANGNLRAMGVYDPEDLEKIDLDRGLEIYAERFANAGNFEFFITGNVELDSLTPLLEQYIGSLPGNPDQKEDFKDMGIRAPRDQKEIVEVGVDQKSQVILYFSGETPYDRKKAADFSYLGEILTIKLIESLREEIGGVYGVGANGSLSSRPTGNFSFSVNFPCSPEKVESLLEATWVEIQKIQETGPSADDLNKVKEKRRIALEENLKRNGYWNAQLSAVRTYGFSWDVILEGEKSIDSMTPARVQSVAKEFLTKENLLEIRKNPAKALQ